MATQVQSAVSSALQELKLEWQDAPDGIVGGPQELKVTAETIEFLKSVEGESLVVESDGTITRKAR